MNKPTSNTSKRIHSIKHWLDKAEASYEKDDSIKGKIQLLVANAEMQQLQEKENRLFYRRSSWSFIIVIATAVLILIGAWGIHSLQDASDPLPSTTATETKTDSSPSPAGQTGTIEPETKGSGIQLSPENKSGTEAVTASPAEHSQGESIGAAVSKVVAQPAAVVKPSQDATSGKEKAVVIQKAPVSEDQVEAAVRLGGRALRGQDK